MTSAIAKKFINSFYFYRVIYLITAYGLWSYLHFLVMRHFTNFYDAVPMIFINTGTYHIGLMIGYSISIFSVSRFAYRGNFRLSYLVLIFAALLALLNINNILEVYHLIALIHGIGAGIYWQTINTFQLRELHGDNRGHTLSVAIGWEYLAEVVAPALFGFLITQFSYHLIFAIGIGFYIIAILFSDGHRLEVRNDLKISEFKRIIKSKGFWHFSLITFAGGVLEDQRSLIMTILPFILIGNELDAGLFSSFMGIVAVGVVFAQRNYPAKDKVKFGYLGSFLATTSTTIFTFIWTVPALTVRNIIARIGFAFWTPIKADLDNQVQELILKNFLRESAVEMSYLREISLFSSRLFNLFFFAGIFYVLKFDVESVLKVILFITAAREPFMLFGNMVLANYLKIGPTVTSSRAPILPHHALAH